MVLLESERDNLRLALDFLMDVAPGEALRMAVALYRYWLYRGRNSEGVRYFAAIFHRLRATDVDAGHPPLLARGQLLAANLALYGGDHDTSHELALAGLASYRMLEDPAGLASGHTTLSALMLMRGDLYQAVDHGHTAVSLARRCGDQRLHGTSLNNLAAAFQNMGPLGGIATALSGSPGRGHPAGDDFCADIALHNLADNARLRGDNYQADRFFRRGVPLRCRVASRAGAAHAEGTWAVVKAALGDQVAAESLAESAIRNGADSSSPYGRGPALWGRAEVDRAAGRPAAAGFASAVVELIACGYYATAVEALSGLVLESGPELAARPDAAARFLQKQHHLYVPAHVQDRFTRSRQHNAGNPITGVFRQADLADLLADLRALADVD